MYLVVFGFEVVVDAFSVFFDNSKLVFNVSVLAKILMNLQLECFKCLKIPWTFICQDGCLLVHSDKHLAGTSLSLCCFVAS